MWLLDVSRRRSCVEVVAGLGTAGRPYRLSAHRRPDPEPCADALRRAGHRRLRLFRLPWQPSPLFLSGPVLHGAYSNRAVGEGWEDDRDDCCLDHHEASGEGESGSCLILRYGLKTKGGLWPPFIFGRYYPFTILLEAAVRTGVPRE